MDYIPFIIAILGVFAVTAFLTYFYAKKGTPFIAHAATFVGWVFGFLLVGLLPYDIYLVRHIKPHHIIRVFLKKKQNLRF